MSVASNVCERIARRFIAFRERFEASRAGIGEVVDEQGLDYGDWGNVQMEGLLMDDFGGLGDAFWGDGIVDWPN